MHYYKISKKKYELISNLMIWSNENFGFDKPCEENLKRIQCSIPFKIKKAPNTCRFSKEEILFIINMAESYKNNYYLEDNLDKAEISVLISYLNNMINNK